MPVPIWNNFDEDNIKNSTKQQQPDGFKQLLRSYWQKYCQQSTIHGVRYLYDPEVRYIERLIWTALIIGCIVVTWTSCIVLAERYNSKMLQTVVENPQLPVFQVQFPAVAVCTRNRINWSKFEAAKYLFLPADAEPSMIRDFTIFVERMESLSFGHFESLLSMDDLNLEVLNFIDATRLAQFLAPTCEDIFLNGSCQWRRANFNCCERFIMEKTEWGMCLVFNSELSDASKFLKLFESPSFYPLHNSMAGQGTGLNFFLNLKAHLKRNDSKVDDSVLIVIKVPDQWSDSGYTITPNTESYVIVRPEITNTDDSTRGVDPEQRNCLFADERNYVGFKALPGIPYRQENCLNVCHEEHMIQYCNCTLPLFFPNNPKVRSCEPADFRCFGKNNDVFSYDKRAEEDAYFSSAKTGMMCFCLVSCHNVQYYTSITTLPLTSDAVAATQNSSVDIFKVDVHYQADVAVQYRTSLEFTSIDLIANFGGIFGLCLGASMVSAVELLYHLTFGFGLYLHNQGFYVILVAKWRFMGQQLKVLWHRLNDSGVQGQSKISPNEYDLDYAYVAVKPRPPLHRQRQVTEKW